ncbi:CPBP family intramembrane glutamic endopeptidase [Nocardiopsis sp. HUAS JQ3]|uniref:CPBP family intramembrane glutamic endopeptidase n=1 Tax=Nocardiopsis sp. HUAS JQ3 TaxID=3061629 RepID=UPI0023AA0EDD|nr:CPBP family intramembrane glutamic endopeptidase [Nocardiopsis sp. HUAS JQ3]WDZ93447.1 CPBP family intramembrane metalloprotease [Nocardiopsis sp. HUAS JQ3]
MHSNDERPSRAPLPQTGSPFSTTSGAGPAQAPAPEAPSGPAAPHPRRGGPRPVPPGVEYHRVLAGDKPRIGRGILAITLLVVGMFAFGIAIAAAAAFVDSLMGRTNPTFGGTDYTPLFHAANLFSIALLIPWSMFLQRWLYGVKGASLHSVLSSFRFDLLGRALLFMGPLWLAVSIAMFALKPQEQVPWSPVSLLSLFALTLVLTPLQGAGEEYGYRGLVFRVAGSWSRGPRTALVVSVLVSSLVFAVVHLSGDLWHNVLFFVIGASMALITWRTGGIEVSIVWHALNNTLSFLIYILLHADLNAALERSAGTGTITLAIPCVALVVITAVVWWRTRKTGPALTPSGPQPTHS